MHLIGDLITPEVRELMDRIERLGAECKAEKPGAGYSRAQQEYSTATYWGAPKLVELLRTLDAALGAPAAPIDDKQLALDLAA